MIIPILLSLFMFASISNAATPSIIIESAEVGSPNANDEYIVLRNVSASPIDISKWSIQCRSNGSTTVQKKNFNPDTIIQPQESYRLAYGSGRFAASAQMTYTTLNLVEKGGVLGLFNSTNYATTFEEPSLVSSFYYGATTTSPISTPAAPATTTIASKSVTASPEFIGQISEYPKSWPIRLSELLPNPTTGDEFIEIENTSGEGVDVSGLWLKDASGASYALGMHGENTVLGAYELRIWPRSQTHLALNNTDGETVILADQTNKITDEIYYTQDAPSNTAYARLGKSWLWTTQPTPSTKNIISSQQIPPYARAEIPNKPIKTHELFSVSAADSTDLNDTIASYEWDFGDGSKLSGINQSYSYTATGTFPISLTITDTFGATSSVSRRVTVIEADEPPKKISVSAAGISSAASSRKKSPPSPQFSGIVQIPPGILGRRRFVVNGRTVEFTTERKELPLLQRGSLISFSAHEIFKVDRLILQISARDIIKVAAITTAPPYSSFHGVVTSLEKSAFTLATTSTDYLVQSGLRYSDGNRVQIGDKLNTQGVLLSDDSDRPTIVVPNQQALTLITKTENESRLPNSFFNILILVCTTGSFILLHLFLTRYGKNYATTHVTEYLQHSIRKFRSLPKQITDYIQAR